MDSRSCHNPYDEVPYESSAFPQSHPDRLHTLAKMLGLNPTPVTRCRVLELGCASGGNLIPMAYWLPESEFVGIDLSSKQVEAATEFINALQLDNVQVYHRSILSIDKSWGGFDYIICHGVYSWVPAPVRKKILQICRQNLNPDGVAYVSYNTYPGWHMREMVRHMMLYHAGQFADPSEQVEQARALLDFLAESLAEQQTAYSRLLQDELRLVRKAPDYYLYHDHLEEENAPLYFHQFVRNATRSGLQYLADAELHTMLPHGFSDQARETLERIGKDQVQREQYLDFLRNRFFRQSLLCHREQHPDSRLVPERIESMLIVSQASASEGMNSIDLRAGRRHAFLTTFGQQVETSEPITKAALLVLNRCWPRALPFTELIMESRRLLAEENVGDMLPEERDRYTLASDILWCFASGVVEVKSWQPDYLTSAGERPVVSRLNQVQWRLGRPLVNHRHESVSLDPVSRVVFPYLNGDYDRDALLSVLEEKFEDGSLTLRSDVPFEDAATRQEVFQTVLDQALNNLARSALLCSA